MNKKSFFLVKSFFLMFLTQTHLFLPKFQILSALIMIGASTCTSVIARDYCT